MGIKPTGSLINLNKGVRRESVTEAQTAVSIQTEGAQPLCCATGRLSALRMCVCVCELLRDNRLISMLLLYCCALWQCGRGPNQNP